MRNFLFLTIAFLSIATVSCNVTGGIDKPQSTEDKLSEAKALLDNGKCDEAVSKLDSIQANDPAVARLRGWASMCRGGATIATIGRTILSYSTTMTNLNVVGQLANALVQENDTKVNFIREAVNSFKSMPSSADADLNIAIADIALAAAIMAKYSSDGVRVIKTDITSASCQSVSPCTGATVVNCPASPMSNQDSSDISTALTEANTKIGSNAALGTLQTLVSLFGTNAAAPAERCYIVTQMIPN